MAKLGAPVIERQYVPLGGEGPHSLIQDRYSDLAELPAGGAVPPQDFRVIPNNAATLSSAAFSAPTPSCRGTVAIRIVN
jgi:hypothetical protein